MVVTSKMNSASLPPARPDSEQLVDLHVYLVPPDVWNDKYQSAYNEVINETISVGFVRVWPELSIWNLREELRNQLGPASMPEEFVYVRSVGRCLTQVKGRQELELKVKAFLPPKNFAPEIFILEGVQDVPDTALIEETKDVAVSTMEVDEEESMEEKENKETYPYKDGQRPILPKGYRQDNTYARQAPSTVSHKAQPSKQNPSLPLLQPHSNHPPVALPSPSPHPSSNSHAYPIHPRTLVSTPKTLPRSTMPNSSNLSGSFVSPRRQGSQSRMSRSSSSVILKRQGLSESLNHRVISRKESENSMFSVDKRQSSQRTYSQTTEETLPGFSSMSESQQSETSPPHNSVTLPVKEPVQGDSTPLAENELAKEQRARIHGESSARSHFSDSFHTHPSNSQHVPHSKDEPAYPENLTSYKNRVSATNDDESVYSHNPSCNVHHISHTNNKPFSSETLTANHHHVSHTNEELVYPENHINSLRHSDQNKPQTPQYPLTNPPELRTPFTNSPPLTNHARSDHKNDINHALPVLPVLSSHAPTHPVSDSEGEPQLTTPNATAGLSKLQSPRKEVRQDTFTKNTNSDSGLGEQTPEETQERIVRGSEGPQTFESRQEHHPNQYETITKSRPFIGADEGQEHQHYYQEDSPRSYQQSQNYPSRTQREDWGPQPHPVHGDQRDYFGERGSQGGQSAMHPVHGTFQDLSPRGGHYEQRGRPPDSLSNQEKLFTPRTQRDEGVVQDSSYNPQFSGGTSSRYGDNMRNQQGHSYSYGSAREPITDQADDTQEAMAFLQLSNEDTTPRDKQQSRYDSPSDLASGRPMNPEKQRLLHQIREEQQGRLEMEKMREELIKKAKNLQGKTIDRRKKARDYWKKRYYDEKKKTPSLEEQVAKLSSQVQQQNRKLMKYLEGKGAKAPTGPPSKRMDHKIQIFKHQHDMEDLKRLVDNARMKLATEIKLRTQAETELRVLKSEVIQKKINVTLKRGKQLQAIQKSEDKSQGRTPLPKGAGGSSI